MTATTEARDANRLSSQFSTTFCQDSESSKSFDSRFVQRKDAGAGSSVWYERRIRNGKPAVSQLPLTVEGIDWNGFRKWVDREYRPKVADDRFRYAKEYYGSLLARDFHGLMSLKVDKRLHVLASLSALSKFLGIYGDFRSLVSNYGLKWNVRNDDLLIARFTKKTDANSILDWVKLVKAKCPELSDFMDFITITGLRYDEAVESYNLIIKLARERKLGQYYNEGKVILEHYRFKEIFIRRTKKAFISFVPKELIQKLGGHESLNIHSVQTRVKRRCMKLAFSDIRELHATLLTKHLKEAEIDFL